MTTLNGLPRYWEAFIRGICSRRKLTKFQKLWEECVQEEERIAARKEKLNDNEDQALTSHTKGKIKSHDHPTKIRWFKIPKRDFSIFECFNYHKIGHIAINCPFKEERIEKIRRFQAHAVEDSDQGEEEEAKKDEDSGEEYVLISSLTGSVSPGNDTWVIYSGASKHMIGFKESLSCLEQKE